MALTSDPASGLLTSDRHWRRRGIGKLAQQAAGLFITIDHAPRSAKLPVFRPVAQSRTKRIAFDRSQHRKQMVVALDGKCLEASLITMAGARRVRVRMPSHRVSLRQPAENIRQLVVGLRADDKVPVIWHQAVRKHWQRLAFHRLTQHSFERFVILRFSNSVRRATARLST
jgi:hypothetical protein